VTLSVVGRINILTQDTSEHYVLLVELDHANFDGPLRFCSDTEAAFVHVGETFTPLALDVTLPTIEEAGLAGGELVMDNVGEEPVASLRSADSFITVTVRVVLASAPDIVQFGPHVVLGIPAGTYDSREFRLQLGHATVLDESYPQMSYNLHDWKGMG